MKKLFVVLAAMLTFTSTAFAQLGSLASDLVYTPVTPCRIFDTRTSQGGTGPIPAAGTKNFVIWGVSSYASQGGAASNCGITADLNTAAVAVNFTVVSPATPGYITAFPFGTTQPTAATVNFNAGDVRGNFSIAKNAQSGASALSIFSTSNVDVVGDVVGYYSKPVATALDCTTVAGVSTPLPASSVNTFAPAPNCASGYTKVGVLCGTSTNANRILGTTLGGCFSANNSASPATVISDSVCCRIPGR